jgi:hypothetical protein
MEHEEVKRIIQFVPVVGLCSILHSSCYAQREPERSVGYVVLILPHFRGGRILRVQYVNKC